MSRISNLVEKARKSSIIFKQGKMFIPTDCITPETPKSIMARTMLQSGLITKDDYEKMLGISYDLDVISDKDEDFNFEDYDDDFKLSSFAEYEENLEVQYVKEESKTEKEKHQPSSSNESDSEIDSAEPKGVPTEQAE